MKISKNLQKLSKIFHPFAPLYVVGGYVRDFLLNVETFDIDICSKLQTNEVVSLLQNTEYHANIVNEKLGTIVIVCDGEKYEYTPFRKENYQMNGVHTPTSIDFCADIYDDMRRRDFTVNALYYDIENGAILGDLRAEPDILGKIMRTVKDADLVFKEDALRIFRLIRQASLYDFGIEDDTFIKAKQNANLINNLSCERVVEEYKKFTKSTLFDYDKMDRYVDLLFDTDVLLIRYKNEPKFSKITNIGLERYKPCVEFLYLYIVLKYYKYLFIVDIDFDNFDYYELDKTAQKIEKKVLQFIIQDKLPNITKSRISKLVSFMILLEVYSRENHKKVLLISYYYDIINTLFAVDTMENIQSKSANAVIDEVNSKNSDCRINSSNNARQNAGQCLPCGSIADVDNTNILESVIDELNLLKEKTPLSIKDLAIDGQDLVSIGIVGGDIKKALIDCLVGVLSNEVSNDKAELLAFVVKRR